MLGQLGSQLTIKGRIGLVTCLTLRLMNNLVIIGTGLEIIYWSRNYLSSLQLLALSLLRLSLPPSVPPLFFVDSRLEG